MLAFLLVVMACVAVMAVRPGGVMDFRKVRIEYIAGLAVVWAASELLVMTVGMDIDVYVVLANLGLLFTYYLEPVLAASILIVALLATTLLIPTYWLTRIIVLSSTSNRKHKASSLLLAPVIAFILGLPAFLSFTALLDDQGKALNRAILVLSVAHYVFVITGCPSLCITALQTLLTIYLVLRGSIAIISFLRGYRKSEAEATH